VYRNIAQSKQRVTLSQEVQRFIPKGREGREGSQQTYENEQARFNAKSTPAF